MAWLLDPKDPFIRYPTLVDVLGRPRDSKEAVEARRRISSHPIFKRIMSAQSKSGYWPRIDTCDSPRFRGALWALTLLGEMAAIPDSPIKKECERFLNLHQTGSGAFSYDSRLKVSTQHDEPCLTGNMARTLIVLGYYEDPRVKKAVDWMPEAQLEDGGWNCDYPEFEGVPVKHSSFTSNHHNWIPMNPRFTTLHFPMYYYYDTLHGLRVLSKLGYADDERMRDAVHLILSKRNPDGRWVLESDWFNELGESTRWLSNKPGEKTQEPTDPWGNSIARWSRFDLEPVGAPSKWVTLNCYRALSLTGDLDPSKG